jgi:hypothetical protein
MVTVAVMMRMPIVAEMFEAQTRKGGAERGSEYFNEDDML